MARRTVQIKITLNKPDEFLTLCEDVIQEHIEQGATSPFAAGDLVDMADYSAQVTLARQERNKALQHYAIAETAMAKSREIMGDQPGQYSTTPGTLLNTTLNIKKILLALNTVNPEALSVWGFDVVVRTARSPKARKKTTG